MPPQQLPVTDFKAKCLHIIDEVSRTGEPLVITKHGRPVAQLVPLPPAKPLFGMLKGSVLHEGDIVSSTGESWEADR